MTEEKNRENKTYDLKIIKWLFQFAKPYKLFMILSFVLMLFTALLELTIPYLAKVAIDSYLTPRGQRYTELPRMKILLIK